VGLEGLLSELLVAAVLDSVDFESVGVRVDVMVLGEEVRDGVEGKRDEEAHGDDNLGVGDLVLAEEGDVLGDVVGHLGGGGGGAIVVLDHTVMELRGHGDDHVIEVGVEVTTLGDIETEGGIVVVASQQVVRVVGQTGGVSGGLGEFRRPHTLVGVLRLMDSHVWGPDSVMDLTLAEIPLLEVVTAVLLMSGVNFGEELHLVSEFALGETLFDEEIVLLMHGSVATLAGSGEDLEAASQTKLNKN